MSASLATTASAPDWRPKDVWCLAVLVLLTAIPYWQVVGFDFVSLDDRQYVTDSKLVQQGLDPLAMWDALAEFHADNWHPLIWWSWMLDFQLFGNNPRAFHLENLLWHVLNVVLLFMALRDLTGDTFRSAVVAAIFGVHPLHVESVAWISERKDVLSGFFWMLGLWSYSYWSRATHSRGLWLIVTISIVLGLMAKQIVVTLPCVFLLLDAWPLGRFYDPRFQRPTVARTWWLISEKLPWFVLSLIASVIAMNAQQSARQAQADWSLALRVSNAAISVFRYLGKSVYPVRLSIQYPYDPPTSQAVVLGAAILLVIVTIVLLVLARRQAALLVGWLWFLGTLFPVIGLIQLGMQPLADRYMYLPLIGLSIGLVWAIPTPRSHGLAWCLAGVTGLCLAGLAIGTARQAAVWRNSETLYDHALAVDPTNEHAHYAIGFRACESRNVAEGLIHLHTGIEWDRRRADAREAYSGNQDSKERTELNRRWSEIYLMLGRAAAGEHHPLQAITDFQQAVALSPTNHDARMALGMALADESRTEEAIAEFEEILKQNPNHLQATMARDALKQPNSPRRD